MQVNAGPFRDKELTTKLQRFYSCYLQNVVFEEDNRGAPVVYTKIAPPVERGMDKVDLVGAASVASVSLPVGMSTVNML